MEPVTMVNYLQKEKKLHEDADRKAEFTEIFELYYKRLYNYTYYRVSSHEVTSDLTSQVFEKIMLKFNSYTNEKSKFEVWLFTIARNTINDYFRKQKRYKIISIDNILDLLSRDKGPEELIIDKERNDELINALSILDAKERNLIAYIFGANLKNVEIAKILKISESNVGVKIHRIMRKLNKCEAEIGYSTCLWSNFINSVILYDKNGELGKLQKKYRICYPEKLKENIIRKNYPILMKQMPAYYYQIEKELKRNDYISINHRITAPFASYFDSIFAINEVPHPSEKNLLKALKAII